MKPRVDCILILFVSFTASDVDDEALVGNKLTPAVEKDKRSTSTAPHHRPIVLDTGDSDEIPVFARVATSSAGSVPSWQNETDFFNGDFPYQGPRNPLIAQPVNENGNYEFEGDGTERHLVNLQPPECTCINELESVGYVPLKSSEITRNALFD